MSLNEIDKFIEEHKNQSVADLSLKLSKKTHWPKAYIINQVNGRQKAVVKFPFLINNANYLFPSPRAVAQASSEKTAKFKASLVEGKTLVDLSGGMGMDTYFFSKQFDSVTYIEKDQTLFELSKSNFNSLEATNINCINSDAKSFIEKNENVYDCIFIDPDRRDKNQRHFRIEDCNPNVLELMPVLLKTGKQLLIKLSPLLDIKLAVKQLKYCKKVYIIAVENDCKELLFFLDQKPTSAPSITAINLVGEKEEERFSFLFEDEINCQPTYSTPLSYLYEPNAAIMKSGAFNYIAKVFDLKKLAANTHLYTSDNLIDDFPGRKIEIEDFGKAAKNFCPEANVVSRNFGLKAEVIRKKYEIKEGNKFLYACRLSDKKKVFILGKLMK